MSRPSRAARAAAGAGFLAIAGAMSSRRAPGRIALWPAALVPTWFGISHLVAAVTGYSGCPELGAIPSVMLARPVATGCGPWERIDRRLRSEREARLVEQHLRAFPILRLERIEDFVLAAELYRRARSAGITIGKTWTA